MAGKKKLVKAKGRSKSSTSTQNRAKTEKSKRPKSSSPPDVKKREPVDILSPVAMINAYYICHGVTDCLEKRGFKWDGAKKKKKKK